MIDDKEALLVLRTIDGIQNNSEEGSKSANSDKLSKVTNISKEKVLKILKYLDEKSLIDARFASGDNALLSCFIVDITAYGYDYLKEQLNFEKTTRSGKSEERGNMIKKDTTKIFITHGHDSDFRNAVELFLKNNNIEVIILEKMVSKGRAIIEKLEQNINIKCAIVLMSPDDELTNKEETVYRARQNVIWEYGFFAGLLSREKIIYIKNSFTRDGKKVTIELPSNMSGLIWIDYDKSKRDWKIELSAELKEIGYTIDPAK